MSERRVRPDKVREDFQAANFTPQALVDLNAALKIAWLDSYELVKLVTDLCDEKYGSESVGTKAVEKLVKIDRSVLSGEQLVQAESESRKPLAFLLRPRGVRSSSVFGDLSLARPFPLEHQDVIDDYYNSPDAYTNFKQKPNFKEMPPSADIWQEHLLYLGSDPNLNDYQTLGELSDFAGAVTLRTVTLASKHFDFELERGEQVARLVTKFLD